MKFGSLGNRLQRQEDNQIRKTMRRIIIPIVAFVSIYGCCPKLYPHKTENTEHIVTITEAVRDTVIQVQPDYSIVQALIKCDSTGRARLEEIRTLKESARVQQTLVLKDNRLTTKVVVDSMGIYLTYKERHKEERKIQTIETIIEKEVNVLKWWQKTLMWVGVITVFSIALFGVMGILKFRIIK